MKNNFQRLSVCSKDNQVGLSSVQGFGCLIGSLLEKLEILCWPCLIILLSESHYKTGIICKFMYWSWSIYKWLIFAFYIDVPWNRVHQAWSLYQGSEHTWSTIPKIIFLEESLPGKFWGIFWYFGFYLVDFVWGFDISRAFCLSF